MKSIFVSVGAACLLILASCSSNHVVPTTGVHMPTSPDQVKIYQNPPAKYEILATLGLVITPDLQWDAYGNADAAFDRMKEAAASYGANGLLVDPKTLGGDVYVAAGYHGTIYTVPVRHNPNTAINQAIFVLKE